MDSPLGPTMGTGRTAGAILLVISVPVFVAALVLVYSTDPPIPAFAGGDAELSGYLLAGLGAVLLVVGVVLLVVSPKAPRVQAGVPAESPQVVEIKRTEMDWGAGPQKTVADELHERLETVNQKIGRAKVRFGMGQLSKETYKTLIAELEAEKAVVERQILDETPG